jgi:hypothetical protein
MEFILRFSIILQHLRVRGYYHLSLYSTTTLVSIMLYHCMAQYAKNHGMWGLIWHSMLKIMVCGGLFHKTN